MAKIVINKSFLNEQVTLQTFFAKRYTVKGVTAVQLLSVDVSVWLAVVAVNAFPR